MDLWIIKPEINDNQRFIGYEENGVNNWMDCVEGDACVRIKAFTVDTKVKPNIEYKTKTINGVRYYGKANYSPAIYTLKKIGTPSVYKYSSSKVTVKGANISVESGHQISRSVYKTGTNIVSKYPTTTGTARLVSETKGKTYYYKVRAYKIVDNKPIYGPW